MVVLIYIFIITAILMGVFCMFVIVRDIIREEKARREQKKNQIE